MTNRLTTHLDCTTCRPLLPAYVRLQLRNQPADATYPAVAVHIHGCDACQAAYYREFRSQGLATPLAQLQQVGRRAAVDKAMAQILGVDQTPWWMPVNQTLHRLEVELLLWVDKARALFENLPAPFTPQPAFAGALRMKTALTAQEAEGVKIELVRLHPPKTDLEIAISVVAVSDYKCTLAIWVKTLSTGQPIAQDRVTLRTGEGSLLEMNATDADGLALFRGLEVARYLVQVVHAGQTWEFALPLAEFPPGGQS